ncbi:hypothetical protein [Nocardioides sp.]|uniref:hypothetical protein n=1 Tax=Nocardioides sp. TaxID=35761 RepID=UPI00262EA791|nr:hypothetical protein [Nocardioides sp.]MDI6908647.1 hypothetical protein [Nocardioides sp.]
MNYAEMFVGSWLATYMPVGVLEVVPETEGTASTVLYDHFAAYVEAIKTGGLAKAQTPSITAWGRRMTELGYPPRSTATHKTRPLRLIAARGVGLGA